MKKIIIILISLCFVLADEDVRVPKVRKLKNISTNKKTDISEFYNNKNIIFNFWNLACIPCRKEMKHLDIFNKKYNEYNFEVISINMDSQNSLSKVKSFVKAQDYSFKVINDPRSELFRRLSATIMPYTILVEKGGIIKNKHTGFNPGDEVNIEKELIHLLGIDSLLQVFSLDSINNK